MEEGFKESTFEREKMAYTSFSYGYAIPHALNYLAVQSTMSIAILKKPVEWGDYQVCLVLFLAIREDEKDLLKIFFTYYLAVIQSPQGENSQRFCRVDRIGRRL